MASTNPSPGPSPAQSKASRRLSVLLRFQLSEWICSHCPDRSSRHCCCCCKWSDISAARAHGPPPRGCYHLIDDCCCCSVAEPLFRESTKWWTTKCWRRRRLWTGRRPLWRTGEWWSIWPWSVPRLLGTIFWRASSCPLSWTWSAHDGGVSCGL